MPPLRVADLGCGDGYLTIEIAGWARDVVRDCNRGAHDSLQGDLNALIRGAEYLAGRLADHGRR